MLKIISTAICCAAYLSGWAQFTVSGKVSDNSGPLAGATIQSDRGNYFAITNDLGEFQLENVKRGEYVLLIRFLGFKEKQERVVINENKILTITLEEDTQLTEEVTVYATRAAEKGPTTFTNINKMELKKQNFGQDLPFVLNYTPSLVTTSDAGAGVGYTGLRIRGSDATRINVTINGIPYNDSETQAVFWVDIPDIATATQSIQIQRGVGTSTNGAGAFGASINLHTMTKNESPYAEIINSVGSFNTRRHTIGLGTGMINNRFGFDARASLINSDGYIDRASSDLKSYYASGGYFGKNTIIKAVAFGGHEVTYQSWNGVPESRLNNDVTDMLATAAAEGWNTQQTDNLLNSNSRTFNIYDYENQIDNYSQDNFQLHFSHQASRSITANLSFHYTPGKGYYEEFKYNQSLSNYGVPDVVIGAETITKTDLIRRRWLDNDFYGITYSLNYERERYSGVLGGAWNRYEGEHFGEIIWAEVALTAPKDFRYYSNHGDKKDINLFWKSNYTISDNLVGYLDLQLRRIDYQAHGVEKDLSNYSVNTNFNFFNPKIGLTYELKGGSQIYSSYAVAQREPVRADFINAPTGTDPKPEILDNVEVGWRVKRSNYNFNINYYLMNYKDQLVLTGELNDVGAAIRTNVDKSYRTGIELEGAMRVSSKITFGANVTLSENKIKNFTEVIYDYGINYDEYNEIKNRLKDVDISFSPSVIAGSSLSYNPFENFEATFLSKFVGEQFLDNTSNRSRKIDAYFVNDLRVSYSPSIGRLKDFSFSILASNIFDVAYESNGYTYGFMGGGETIRQNYYYPQAGRNYLMMLSLKF